MSELTLDPAPPAADPAHEGHADTGDDLAGRRARVARADRRARRRTRLALGAALGFLVLVALLAVAAPLVTPDDPAGQDLLNNFQGPGADHWLGTDQLGRDTFTRIVYGGRASLGGPMIALAVAVTLGLPAGLIAGYRRGATDWALTRVADTLLSVPAIVLAISLVAVLGPSLVNAMLVIGLVYAPHLFRVVRASTTSLSEETFIESARSLGCRPIEIVFVHVLPNIAPVLLVQVSFLLGYALLAEASLSFLGLGIQPPNPSWGVMLRDAYENRSRAPYSVVAPGVAISLTVLCFNVLGDGVSKIRSGRER